MSADHLLTVADVASILRVPRSWVYGHICGGTLPFEHLKIGHFVRFRREAIDQYLNSVTKSAQTNVLAIRAKAR